MKRIGLIFLILNLGISWIYTQEIEYQSEDPLLSTYRENEHDGYSWIQREPNYDRNDLILSKEKLVSTVWMHGQFSGLVFFMDDRFAYGGYHSGQVITGRYVILNDQQVELIADSENFTPYDGFKEERTLLTLITNRSTIHQSHYLESDRSKFYARGAIPQDGDEIYVIGERTIKEQKRIRALANVNIRNAPSLDSTVMDFSAYEIHTDIRNGVLQSGEVITQYAYKEESESIGGKEGCWLVIGISYEFEEMYEETIYGWVFSPYFEDANP